MSERWTMAGQGGRYCALFRQRRPCLKGHRAQADGETNLEDSKDGCEYRGKLLKKGEKKLFEYEEKLRVMEKNIIQEEKIDDILSEIEKIEDSFTDEDIVNILDDIKSKIRCLV